MKKSGFRKKSYEEVKAQIGKSKALKSTRLHKVAGKTAKSKKRDKLPTVKSVRNKCDNLLTPIIKKMYPYCLLTGQPTEVAHHHVKKSESNALRYYIPNLIPLTHKAHMALHSHETIYSSKIVAIRGIEWWDDLERMKRTTVKTDVHFYLEHLKRLEAILASL
jgi:5-methylcytosine-specific restriction endonuclease McrA